MKEPIRFDFEVYVTIFDEVCACKCYSLFEFDLRLNNGIPFNLFNIESDHLIFRIYLNELHLEYTRMNGLFLQYLCPLNPMAFTV